MKVNECQNYKHQGNFVGDICCPCYRHITTGEIGATSSFLGKYRELLELVDYFQKWFNSGEWKKNSAKKENRLKILVESLMSKEVKNV